MNDAATAERPGQTANGPLVVPPRLRWLSDVIWRSAIVVSAALLIGLVLWHLKVVVLPIFIALLICTVLTGPVVWLENRGWKSGRATAVVFLTFLIAVSGIFFLIIPPAVQGVSGLGEKTTDAMKDIENWLVDGPLELDRKEVRKYTTDPVGQLVSYLSHSSSTITTGARMVGETLIGILLTLVITFFMLKDGRKFQNMILDRLHGPSEGVIRRAASRSWAAFGGYIRGSATMGILEAFITGGTIWLVGAPLALPIAVLSFFGAFFPMIGALVVGGLAVLVTAASAGVAKSLIVLGVVIAVHQLDGNLLGPFVFGKALDLHPIVVLVVLTAGGSLGGIAGAFVAVPLTGAVIGAVDEFWKGRRAIDGIASDNGNGDLTLPGHLPPTSELELP